MELLTRSASVERLEHRSATDKSNKIGLIHGREAAAAIGRSIAFYTWQFKENAKLSWSQVRVLALDFEPTLQKKWPQYLEEMRGQSLDNAWRIGD